MALPRQRLTCTADLDNATVNTRQLAVSPLQYLRWTLRLTAAIRLLMFPTSKTFLIAASLAAVLPCPNVINLNCKKPRMMLSTSLVVHRVRVQRNTAKQQAEAYMVHYGTASARRAEVQAGNRPGLQPWQVNRKVHPLGLMGQLCTVRRMASATRGAVGR